MSPASWHPQSLVVQQGHLIATVTLRGHVTVKALPMGTLQQDGQQAVYSRRFCCWLLGERQGHREVCLGQPPTRPGPPLWSTVLQLSQSIRG